MADPKALHRIFTTVSHSTRTDHWEPLGTNHIQQCYNYPKSLIMRPLMKRLAGESLVWAEGEQHKKQRQMLSSVFTHDRVRASEEEIRAATNRNVSPL